MSTTTPTTEQGATPTQSAPAAQPGNVADNSSPSLSTATSHISDIITQHDKCYSLLSNPSILVKRPNNLSFHFVAYRQPNVYELYNMKGEPIGKLQERSEGVTGFIKRNVLPTVRSFTMDMIDNDGHVILTIHRGITTALQRSDLKVYIPQENGEDILIGESVHHLDVLKKKYTLKEVSPADGKLHEFGNIETDLFKWKFPIYGKHGEVLAEVCRDFHDLTLQLLSDNNVYIVKMDASAHKDGQCAFGPLSKKPLTLVEKAVVFASVVSIDFNYFSDECLGE